MLTVTPPRTQAPTHGGHSQGLFTSLSYLERGHAVKVNTHFHRVFRKKLISVFKVNVS